MRLTFEKGTLLLRDYTGDDAPPAFIWDARIDHYRAQAAYYRDSLEYLKRTGVEFKNTAPRYNTLSLQLQSPPAPANRTSHCWPWSKSSAARWSLPPPST